MSNFFKRMRYYLNIEDGPQFVEAPVISPPTTREGVAELMQRIDDRRIAWHVEHAKKEWESGHTALRDSAAALLAAYDEYRCGDAIAFVPPADVVAALRIALEAPQ